MPHAAVAGLEAEIGKLLVAARAVQQQYAIKPTDSGRGEQAVEQQQHGGKGGEGGGGAAAAEPGGDVAMQEAGQL